MLKKHLKHFNVEFEFIQDNVGELKSEEWKKIQRIFISTSNNIYECLRNINYIVGFTDDMEEYKETIEELETNLNNLQTSFNECIDAYREWLKISSPKGWGKFDVVTNAQAFNYCENNLEMATTSFYFQKSKGQKTCK
jgi:glutathionyl-hydroquinone reductase